MTNEDDVKTRDEQFKLQQIEAIILKAINDSTGIKATELILRVIRELMPKDLNVGEFEELLTSLVDKGEIVELEYTVPKLDYRVKSIYFPKGTEFLP